MQARTLPAVNTIGYLSCSEDESVGFVGGLLVVNQHARPLEFHCTVPFRPTAAQRVLFGATLNPHLLTDQIPGTLLAKLKTVLDVLLVNNLSLLDLRENTDIALGCLHRLETESDSAASHETGLTIGKSHFLNSEHSPFAIHHKFPTDSEVVQSALAAVSGSVEVAEPFERLRIAIDETCKPGSHAA